LKKITYILRGAAKKGYFINGSAIKTIPPPPAMKKITFYFAASLRGRRGATPFSVTSERA